MTTLNDKQIKIEILNGNLIKNGDNHQISGACYELRLGNVYYDLSESDLAISLKPDEKILIKPGHRVVLITYEELLIPDDIQSRIVSKGSLFSIGLSPVATYADPGFSGNIGIVTQNISNKYILLPQLEPIAKADFTRLSDKVNSRYSGQHGFKTQIWPIKHQLQKTYSDVAKDSRVGTEIEEAYRLLPEATASLLRKLEKRRKILDVGIFFLIIENAILVFSVEKNWIDNVTGLILNIFATALWLGMSMLVEKWK